MTTPLTEYERLTKEALALPAESRADCIDHWREWHEEDGDAHDALTLDLMCQCCGVDYSGFNRDVLDDPAVGTVTPAIQIMLDEYRGARP